MVKNFLSKLWTSSPRNYQLPPYTRGGKSKFIENLQMPFLISYSLLAQTNPTLAEAIKKKFKISSDRPDYDMEVSQATAYFYNEYLTNYVKMFEAPKRRLAQPIIEKIVQKLYHDWPNAKTLKWIPDDFICPISLSIMKEPMKVFNNINGNIESHYMDKEALTACFRLSLKDPLNGHDIIQKIFDEHLNAKIQSFMDNPQNHQAHFDTPKMIF